PPLDLPLISRACRRRRSTAVVTAYARNRIVRIVSVAVRLGIARGGIPRKYAIAAVAVGSAAALEIHSPVLCPGQRIFLFLPPYVPANHVQGNRRFILNAGVHVVEP